MVLVLTREIKEGTMKTLRISRKVVAIAAAAFAAVAFAAVALAGSSDNSHPHLMPTKLIGVPELSAVVWNSPTNSFIQFLVDRGKITAVNGSTISVQQGTAGNVWRTQNFTIPPTAEIHVNGHTITMGTTAAGGSTTSGTAVPSPLSRFRVGMHVRIVQTGAVG